MTREMLYMPFGAHETMEVHEILNEKINMITHFSMYAEECQNQQLRQLLDQHVQTAMQSYNQLVAYTHDYNAAKNQGQAYSMPNIELNQIQYGLDNPKSQMPQTGSKLNDQQIAWAMLSCHKSSAKNHMNALLECADPNIRQMLMNGAITCANQAYEVFALLNQQGQYQIPTMHDHTAKTFLHSYQPMQQNQGAQQNEQNQQNQQNAYQ